MATDKMTDEQLRAQQAQRQAYIAAIQIEMQQLNNDIQLYDSGGTQIANLISNLESLKANLNQVYSNITVGINISGNSFANIGDYSSNIQTIISNLNVISGKIAVEKARLEGRVGELRTRLTTL